MHMIFRATVTPLLCLLLASCARETTDARRPVLEQYAQIVSATYEDALAAARTLEERIDALLSNPDATTLDAARDAWRAARVPYGRSEAFRFYAGPIDAEGGPEGQLNAWPLDENHIDAVASSYNAAPGLDIIGNATRFPEITAELIAQQNEAGGEKNVASGYHAIEFLLWGQDLNPTPDAAGQRPWTDFVPDGDPTTDRAARRGQYLRAATALLVSDLEQVAAAWAPDADNYRRAFVTGDAYTGIKRMLTGIVALAEVELAGERMAVPLLSGDQEEEQSCFSDTTGGDLRANAAGIEAVWRGLNEQPDGSVSNGPSLETLVAAADPLVAEEVDARLTRAIAAIGAIRDPFDREIHPDNPEGNARVQAGIDALRSLALSLGRAATALGIFMSPIEGSGD